MSGRPGRARLRRIVPLLATGFLAVLMAAPAFPAGPEAGVAQQTSAGPLLEGPRLIVVRDLSAATAEPPGQTRDVRFSRRHPASAAFEPEAPAAPANALDASIPPQPGAPASPSSAGFEGLDNTDNSLLTGATPTPPDPQLAVGPGHVFEMVNRLGRISSRTGATVQTFTLASFFGVPAGHNNFDPKVLYDAISGRWFAAYVSLIDQPGPNNDVSRLHLAISQSSDPTGLWNTYSRTYAQIFPDYPGIGVTDDKFTVSTNLFDIDQTIFYYGEETIVLEKADVLAGLPGPSVGTFAFPRNLDRFTVRPAHSLGTVSDQYLVMRDTATTLTVIRITGTPDAGNVSEASATNLTMLTQNTPPASTALGGNIDSGDYRMLDATWRNGRLWTSASAACLPPADSATRSCAHVIEVDTTQNPPTISQDIMFGAPGEYFSWPALRTDASGDLYVSLTHTNAAIFPEARVTGREAGDPPNTMSGSTVFRTGDVAHDSSRWGDYLGAAVDPVFNECVWFVGEYSRNTAGWNWGTFISSSSYSGGCDGDNDGLIDADDPDDDNDAWLDVSEVAIGTDPLDACADNALDDVWPPDFNSDRSVTGFDLSAVAGSLGLSVPPASPREDIGQPPDGSVTGADLSAVASRVGDSCLP